MKRSTLLKLLLFVGAASIAKGQVINFHNASQGTIPGYNQLYYGQGAYVDIGNNVWNGFSAATYAGGGPGSTLFYGNNNHYPASGGNPGNPYAAYGPHGTVTGGGSVLFGTGGTIDPSGNPTSVPAGNATSHGLLSPVTLSMNYGFDNGATAGSTPGTPSWLLTSAAVVNGASPGVGTAKITTPRAELRSLLPQPMAASRLLELLQHSIPETETVSCSEIIMWSL